MRTLVVRERVRVARTRGEVRAVRFASQRHVVRAVRRGNVGRGFAAVRVRPGLTSGVDRVETRTAETLTNV